MDSLNNTIPAAPIDPPPYNTYPTIEDLQLAVTRWIVGAPHEVCPLNICDFMHQAGQLFQDMTGMHDELVVDVLSVSSVWIWGCLSVDLLTAEGGELPFAGRVQMG